jgi:hypothetical protein
MNKITYQSELPIEYKLLSKTETDELRHQMIMKSSQHLKN